MDLPDRIAKIREAALEALPGDPTSGFGILVCDGCGAVLRFDPFTGEELEGEGSAADWMPGARGEDDFCPDCVARWGDG